MKLDWFLGALVAVFIAGTCVLIGVTATGLYVAWAGLGSRVDDRLPKPIFPDGGRQ